MSNRKDPPKKKYKDLDNYFQDFSASASTTSTRQLPLDAKKLIEQDKAAKLREENNRKAAELAKQGYGYKGNIPQQGTIRSAPTTFERAIRKADVATDVMQLGNFVPHPIGQAIGKTGNVLGSAIDLYQAYDSAKEGNYLDAAINAGSVGLAGGWSLNTFKR